MNASKQKFQEQTRGWWAIMLIGVLMTVAGFAYWLFPVMGYVVASVLFGWLLIAVGVVQLCVSSGANRPRHWGWWLAGGVIDIFVGFMLVRNITLAEALFPYFLAAVFMFWGVSALVESVTFRRRMFWWLRFINGILLLIIGMIFLDSSFCSNIFNVSIFTSLAFVYWGMTLFITSFSLKPKQKGE